MGSRCCGGSARTRAPASCPSSFSRPRPKSGTWSRATGWARTATCASPWISSSSSTPCGSSASTGCCSTSLHLRPESRSDMTVPLRALIIEDSEDDAQLLVRELRRGGYAPAVERVDSAAELERALWHAQWDSVFGDYSMPHFSGTDALAIVRKRSGDVPFIFVSGTIGEDTAVAAMRAGAQDYVVKGNLKRLLPAVERELRDAQERRDRRQAEETLQAIEARLRQVIASTPAVLYATAVRPEGFAPSWVSENIARTMG